MNFAVECSENDINLLYEAAFHNKNIYLEKEAEYLLNRILTEKTWFRFFLGLKKWEL